MNYEFSIIIPVWNKSYELNLVLKSISLIDYDKSKFEVIIIDDGSTDKITDITDKYKKLFTINYYYFPHLGNRGKNRNLGVKKSNASRLIFIDSDMIVKRNIINLFDLATKNNKKIISLGLRDCILEYNKNYINEDVIENNFDIIENLPAIKDERTISIVHKNKTGLVMEGLWQLLYSHCFCVWKKEFEEVEGFDEKFCENWGAEDIELGYRLYKNNSIIEINENIKCYHLFHDIDILNKMKSLKLNYDLLVKKHQDWNIELFTREFEAWAIETIDIQEKIKKRENVIYNIINLNKLIKELPYNTLLISIENDDFISNEKIERIFLPVTDKKSEKIKNIIGINTEYENKHFNIVLISEKYKKINYGLFLLILKEAERISKKVIIVKDNEEVLLNDPENEAINKLKKEKNLMFYLENAMHINLNKYNFLNLAIATHKIGINTGVQLAYDPYNKININSGFLRLSDKTDIEIINKLRVHQLSFIGDEIPGIMDSTHSKFSTRALGQRILWEEFRFINEDKEIINKILWSYEKILLKRKWEKKYYPKTSKIEYLPAGIDSERLKKIKQSGKKKNNKFVFLWTDMFTSSFSNLQILLELFCELFKDNNDVLLKIITPGNFLEIYQHDYLSDTLTKFISNYYSYIKLVCDTYLNELVEKYKNEKNIIIINNVYNNNEYSNEINNCDCFIHLNSQLGIFPLVLESIALGKKPIIPYDNRYEDYFENDLCFPVKTKKFAASLSEGTIESAFLSEQSLGRYYLVNKIEKEDLKKILYNTYKSRDLILIDDNKVNDFLEKFNWINIAKMLEKILY